MQTFDQHLYALYHDGKITLEEALRNADSANNLRLRIKLSENTLIEDSKDAFEQKTEEKNGSTRLGSSELKLSAD
jgi:twitching motility protein PilU